MTSSALFCIRCVCLIPYSLVCICLCFLWCIERLAQQCAFRNGSEFLSSRMHAKLARMLNVPATCQTIRQTLCLPVIKREDVGYDQSVYTEEDDGELKEMKEEIEGCNAMLLSLRRERLECLVRHQSDAFFVKLEQSQRLQSHVEDLKKSIEDRQISSQMRGAVRRTGSHGLVDWAERISRTHENVLKTTAQVGFVGAGLTYGSIFGASRGNIGLMCYAFALFVCGFIIPSAAFALLRWASFRPRDTVFTSPRTWKLALNIFTYTSVAAVGCAIGLLNLTLYLLSFPLDASGQPENPRLQLNISPRPAGSVSLGGLSLAIVISLLCVVTHYMARGWNAFVHDFLGRH